jgi:hypothetical protein
MAIDYVYIRNSSCPSRVQYIGAILHVVPPRSSKWTGGRGLEVRDTPARGVGF